MVSKRKKGVTEFAMLSDIVVDGKAYTDLNDVIDYDVTKYCLSSMLEELISEKHIIFILDNKTKKYFKRKN